MSDIHRPVEPVRTKPSPVSPLLARLRAETHDAHERIEALPELSCLMSSTLTENDYVRALRGLHAFHARMHESLPRLLHGLGQHLAENAPVLGLETSGLHALDEDLAWFAVGPHRKMRKPPSLTDGYAALGALYVVEGSALGARVIGRAVSASLGVSPGQGGSFFCGASADLARTRWQSFCAMLAAAGPVIAAAGEEAGCARVVAGALSCFGALEEAICGSGSGARLAASRPAFPSSRPAPAGRTLN